MNADGCLALASLNVKIIILTIFFFISYENPKRIYNIRTYKCYNNNKKNENIKEISYDDGDEWLLGWKKFNL